MARKSKKRSHRGDKKKQAEEERNAKYSPLPELPSFDELPTFNLKPTSSSYDSNGSRKRSIDEISDGETSDHKGEQSKRHRTDKADDEGWQTVPVRVNKAAEKGRNYPEILVYPSRVQSWTRISDLQSLIFQILAHDQPPNWITLKNPTSVRHVVYLFVPGFAMDLFDGRVKLTGEGLSTDVPQSDYHTSLSEHFPRDLRKMSLEAPLQPLSEMFTHVMPVKVGGDNNKIYSPIHHMLNVPINPTLEEERMNKKKPQHQGNSRRNNNTQPKLKVSELLLTHEDLIENEYPVHTAHWNRSTTEPVPSIVEDRGKGWVETPLTTPEEEASSRVNESGSVLEGYKILAIDCEMVRTHKGQELARISIVDWTGKIVLDKFVKPTNEIEDYLTQFSGITEKKLKDVTTTLSDIQEELKTLIDANTILEGQSLNSDLMALHYSHPFIIDTSVIYDHPRGRPMKPALRWLAQKYLKQEIQQGSLATSGGHDSIEDARACLNLLKKKLERGKDFGSNAATMEPIFLKLSRNTPARTGGVVDYGEPAKRFGSSAQFLHRATSDDDAVEGVLTAINGDAMKGVAPVNFVWGHLKELCAARGWNNSYAKFIGELNHTVMTADSEPVELPEKPEAPSAEELGIVVQKTVERIKKVWEALPKCSALVVYGGTSDASEMGRLNALHAVYRKEFKVKKWDQCSVKWTDDEEQALKAATGEARKGISFLTIK